MARGLATNDAARSLRFAKDRKAHDNSMKELRKQWAEERRVAEEEAATQAAAERAAIEAARTRKRQQQQADKTAKLRAREERLKEEKVLRVAAKAARLQRQQLREEVQDVAREQRRAWLLGQSKGWVTAESLDSRIEEALENPSPLFKWR